MKLRVQFQDPLGAWIFYPPRSNCLRYGGAFQHGTAAYLLDEAQADWLAPRLVRDLNTQARTVNTDGQAVRHWTWNAPTGQVEELPTKAHP